MTDIFTPSFEAVIDHTLSGLDEPLNVIRELTTKTDADFIEEGKLNPSLRKANNAAISVAIDAYNQAIKDKQPAATAEQAGLPPETRVAFTYVCENNLILPTWNHRAVGSSYERPIPALPDSAESIKPVFSRTNTFVDHYVAWWRNDSPYFAHINSKTSATIYPSHGHNNVQVREGEHSYSIDSKGTIFAAFENGQKVKIEYNDGRIVGIQVKDKPSSFGHPILGYYNGTSTKPEDFDVDLYERVRFIGTHSVVKLTDAQQYAARVALQVLREQSTGDTLPDVQLPLPSGKFRTEVVEFLARSMVQAFLEPQYTAEVVEGGGMMVGYRVEGVNLHETPNQIRDITESRLRTFLGAAGCTIMEYSDVVRQEIENMRRGNTLGNRIDAIRVEPHVDSFLGSFQS